MATSLPVLAPDWFQDTFLGIEVEQYIGIAVLVAIGLAAHVVAITLLAVYVRHRTAPADHDFWAMERRRLYRPLLVLLVALSFLVGFPTLDFDPDVEEVVEQIASLLGAAAVVFVSYRAIDILTDVLARRAAQTESQLDDQLIPLLNTALKIFVTVVGVLFVLQNLDVNIASLIAGLGIGGLAVALAAQDTIKNLLGGITIFADKPFQVGDWVVVDDIEGTVEHVGFRSTRVRTFANSLVTVPNARMVDTGVDNMGLRRWRRYRTVLGIGYHSRPDQIQAFVEGIRAIIRSMPSMRTDFYLVEFTGFGAASLEILVYCFVDAADWNTEMRTRHILNLNIMRLAEDLEVDFAFPTQTIHIAEMPGQPQQLPSPREREELRRLIEDYAPPGGRGQRADAPISAGYDNG